VDFEDSGDQESDDVMDDMAIVGNQDKW